MEHPYPKGLLFRRKYKNNTIQRKAISGAKINNKKKRSKIEIIIYSNDVYNVYSNRAS